MDRLTVSSGLLLSFHIFSRKHLKINNLYFLPSVIIRIYLLICVYYRSTSTSSKYSINWVKSLGFVKMYHDAELDAEVSYHPGGYQPQHRKIDSILEELTETLSQIPVQSQKVRYST